MSKAKSSLFSLGASGTLGGVLTLQKRGTTHYARKKPTPTDRRTLPQNYQRWLYQDYIAWWHSQTAATKLLWESNARRHHITGFAYWMQDKLSTLSDIACGWHLDIKRGASSPDFSPNGNDLVIVGAIPADGIIDRCLYFDGTDDYAYPLLSTSQNTPDAFTIELFALCLPPTYRILISRCINANPTGGEGYFVDADADAVEFYFYDAAGNRQMAEQAWTPGIWAHVACRFNGTHIVVFINGVPGTPTAVTGFKEATDEEHTLAAYSYSHATFGKQYLDECRISNRALTDAVIAVHSERRFP